MQETKKINPLIALAAVSVTLFSLIGIAVMTGVMPSSFSKNSDTALEAAAPKAQEAPIQKTQDTQAPQAKSVTPPAPKAPTRTAAAKTPAPVAPATPAPAPAAQPQPEPARAPVCDNCGIVASVDAIKLKGEGSGLGAVAGGVVGGLLGHQVGGGTGKKIATVAGAAGGAYAGHQAEKHLKSTVRYDVTVKMDDGTTQTFSYDAQPAFQAGSKVRVVNGTLTAG